MRRVIALLSILFLHNVPQTELYPTGYSLYPMSAEVIEMDYDADIVTVEDANGFLWEFYGCEDYDCGDIVSLIMDANNTPETILDDIVVSAKYSGYYFEK